MPGSIIGELILQPIFEFFFQVICYFVGALVVPILSLGKLKCDGIAKEVDRKKVKCGGLYRRVGNQVFLTADATSLIGLLVLAGVSVGGYFLYRALT